MILVSVNFFVCEIYLFFLLLVFTSMNVLCCSRFEIGKQEGKQEGKPLLVAKLRAIYLFQDHFPGILEHIT